MEESKYVFEAKTIKRMELLVLSTLQWKMNPVTPISFLEYIIRRLGLKNNLCWEFLRRCESIVLSVITGTNLNLLFNIDKLYSFKLLSDPKLFNIITN